MVGFHFHMPNGCDIVSIKKPTLFCLNHLKLLYSVGDNGRLVEITKTVYNAVVTSIKAGKFIYKT